MAYSKIQKILFASLCLFIILFPFWCVRGLCAETENLTPSVLRDARYTTHQIQSYTGSNLYYVQVEPGYRYIFNNLASGSKTVGFSETMEVGATAFDVAQISGGESFSFNGSQYGFLFFGSSGLGNPAGYFTRESLEGMTSAVDNLSYYVGPNIWESFTNSLPFVLPLVLVCFGMYLISYFVNKNSKGV